MVELARQRASEGSNPLPHLRMMMLKTPTAAPAEEPELLARVTMSESGPITSIASTPGVPLEAAAKEPGPERSS